MARGLIISATGSGVGKTVITTALIRAFTAHGYASSAFKVGPDYIDAGYHAIAAGRPCRTIDLWAMRPAVVRTQIQRCADGADLVIGEGVMGLFDGSLSNEGSTADVARFLSLPVILVVDVSGQGHSVAATVAGFRDHRPDVRMAGVILNRVAGTTHRALLKRALDGITTVFGCVDRDTRLELPHRHLGLVQADERVDHQSFIEEAASILARTVDVEGIIATACPLHAGAEGAFPPAMTPPGQRIAIARDLAFSFLYPSLEEGWRLAGAELLPFSPLEDAAPDAHADAVYLPGGYPELFAGQLAANTVFLDGIRQAARRGAVIYGECGGYMVLGETLTDLEGTPHTMAGLLPVHVSMKPPRRHLGYRRMSLVDDGPLGHRGTVWRGHEFHYGTEVAGSVNPLFRSCDANGRDLGLTGAVSGTVAASFLHIIDREE